MADGETNDENKAEVDPFKDFIQAEFKDGVKVEAAKAEPTAEEKAATEAAEAAKVKKVEEPDEFADEDKLPDDANDEDKRIDALAREKAKKMAQGRIGQLTGQLRKTQRDLEAVKKPVTTPTPAAPAATTTPTPGGKTDEEVLAAQFAADPAAPKMPDPEKFEFGNIDTRYIAALHAFERAKGKWLDKAEVALNNTRATEAASLQGQKDFATALESFHDKGAQVEGYAETRAAIEKNEFPVSQPVALLILESDVGHELAVHLHKNPTLAKEINELPAYRQVARVALLEQELVAKKATANPAPRTASSAPAPIASTRATSATTTAAEESTDFQAFEKQANKALGRK